MYEKYTLEELKKISQEKGPEKLYDYSIKKSQEYSYLNAIIGEPLPLKGLVPVGLKDVFLNEGEIVTAGSKTLLNYKSPFTATVIKKLLENKLYPIFRTNLEEFACGSTGINGLNGPILSPLKYANENLIPGGSSSGSASGVAAGIFNIAISTDTGGSTRQPAACCGLFGLCPTYGVISRYGMIPLNSSIDRVGIITKHLSDLKSVFHILKGKDINDPTSCEYIADKKERKSFAVLEEIPCPKEVSEALKALGYEEKRYSVPLVLDALAIYCILTPAELASNLSRFTGTFMDKKEYKNLNDYYFKFRSQFGKEVQRRIIIGNYALLESNKGDLFQKARSLQKELFEEINKIVEENDFIVGLTAPEPWTVKEAVETPDPLKIYLCDIYTVFVNLVGFPAISFPGLLKNQKPLGVQLTGRAFTEDLLMEATEKIIKKMKEMEVI